MKLPLITTKIVILDEHKYAFADWQAKLNAVIAQSPGFISLEIIAPQLDDRKWEIIQRFANVEQLKQWIESTPRIELINELKMILKAKEEAIYDEEWNSSSGAGCVTEVFTTQIHPDKEQAFREWLAKIHRIEAQFPGFKGMYVQSPASNQGKTWMTFLQFDTLQNLDKWLASNERKELLKESSPLIASIESHRMISPYSGWFASLSKSSSRLPPAWKQTMLVLLVLFPIVMIELKWLSPLLIKLDPALVTFIGNAISVSLVSWPMMPIAIWSLRWWLTLNTSNKKWNILGVILIIFLYFFEIVLCSRLVN